MFSIHTYNCKQNSKWFPIPTNCKQKFFIPKKKKSQVKKSKNKPVVCLLYAVHILNLI